MASSAKPCCPEDEEKIPTIAEDIVVTKYKMAAEIVNRNWHWIIHVVSNAISFPIPFCRYSERNGSFVQGGNLRKGDMY